MIDSLSPEQFTDVIFIYTLEPENRTKFINHCNDRLSQEQQKAISQLDKEHLVDDLKEVHNPMEAIIK